METYTTVEPDDNFLLIHEFLGGSRKEPEKELVHLVFLVSDGKLAGIRLADIKVNLGQTIAINNKLCKELQTLVSMISSGLIYLVVQQDSLLVMSLRNRGSAGASSRVSKWL